VVTQSEEERVITSPLDFPELDEITNKRLRFMEPMIKATIVTPDRYLGE
jgi:translation elongation factor EF-4